MEYDINKLHIKALQATASTKTLFAKLKKKKPKNLDLTVSNLHDEVFDEVDCLDCANCCRTLGPRITNKDIERLSSHLKIKESVFVKKYLRIDEDGDYVFAEMPCPFLAPDNYCLVYEQRPKACREYPHTDRKRFYQLLDISLQNTHICPAVYEIVEKLKKEF